MHLSAQIVQKLLQLKRHAKADMAQVLFKDDTPLFPTWKGGIYFFVFKYFDPIFSSRLQKCCKVFENHIGYEIGSHIPSKTKIFKIFSWNFTFFSPLIKIPKSRKNQLQFAFNQLRFHSTEIAHTVRITPSYFLSV